MGHGVLSQRKRGTRVWDGDQVDNGVNPPAFTNEPMIEIREVCVEVGA